MNNPNPFHPQSSLLLEQKDKARARLKIAVFSGLSLSVVALMALLIQGCRKPAEPQPENAPDTNATQTFEAPTNAMPDTNVIPTNMPPPPPVQAVEPTPPPAPPIAAGSEYTIVKGDTFATIAKAHGVTTKAIQDANPGVDPKKLKIGQKIQVPGATSTPVATQSMAPAVTPEATSGVTTYKVKSGDTLTKIAKQFGTTVKAIESANNLSTTSIKVGQSLKIPTKASAPAPTPTPAPAPAPAPAATTMPAPVTAPAGHATT